MPTVFTAPDFACPLSAVCLICRLMHAVFLAE